MLITPASSEDCAELARLHVESWQRAYTGIVPSGYLASLSAPRREASWRQVLAEQQSELLVARLAGAMVGFASFGPSRDGDAPSGRGELWALYVSPRAWSTGVGRALWLAARERLVASGFRSVSLWVIVGNERAIGFYRAAGFRIEPGSEKEFEIGGERVREVRMVVENAVKVGTSA